MCNYNRLLLRFETSNSSKIHTSNLNQNFWHSWGWHFLCTKCPYVESCKLQVGWFRVHTSQRFLKTWHDTTSIASFHITKFKGCLNATFIQWVFVREDHGTKRSKVHQDKKNHVPRRSNRSPRQSCPTLYNTLLRAPCRLFWLVSNWKRTYHITRQHLLFHKESTQKNKQSNRTFLSILKPSQFITLCCCRWYPGCQRGSFLRSQAANQDPRQEMISIAASPLTLAVSLRKKKPLAI